nr:hypothetical protein [uncultured Duganella sp.]
MKKSISDQHFLMAALQTGESMLDTLSSNEVVRAVPVLNLAVGLLKTVDDVRSAALKAKLLAFISDERLRDSIQAQKIRARLESEDAERLGETIFLTLDKVTDLKKPVLLAKVFAAYLDGRIELRVVLLLAHAIDIAFVGDLEYFIDRRGSAAPDEMLAVERLASAGLFDFYVSNELGGGDKHYQLSPMGTSFLYALRLND